MLSLNIPELDREKKTELYVHFKLSKFITVFMDWQVDVYLKLDSCYVNVFTLKFWQIFRKLSCIFTLVVWFLQEIKGLLNVQFFQAVKIF